MNFSWQLGKGIWATSIRKCTQYIGQQAFIAYCYPNHFHTLVRTRPTMTSGRWMTHGMTFNQAIQRTNSIDTAEGKIWPMGVSLKSSKLHKAWLYMDRTTGLPTPNHRKITQTIISISFIISPTTTRTYEGICSSGYSVTCNPSILLSRIDPLPTFRNLHTIKWGLIIVYL